MHIKKQVKPNKPAVTRESLDQLFYISSAAHPAIVGLGSSQELPRKTEKLKLLYCMAIQGERLKTAARNVKHKKSWRWFCHIFVTSQFFSLAASVDLENLGTPVGFEKKVAPSFLSHFFCNRNRDL
jgi:hypothetical protein